MADKYSSKKQYNLDGTLEFQSKLEQNAAKLLTEAGIEFEYEPFAITLIEPQEMTSWEKWGKMFKQIDKTRATTYTPDFMGKYWCIETKGKKTPDFIIKWKLFKKYLVDNKLDDILLFMPTNLKEIKQCIEIIKQKEVEIRRKNPVARLQKMR